MRKTSNRKRLVASKLLFIILFGFVGEAVYARNFMIAIDPGHSKTRGGATSARGIKEYYFNESISRNLCAKIKKHKGLDCFITNPTGNKIALRERTKVAFQKKADLFLSLHHDAVNKKYLKTWTYKKKKYVFSDRFSGHSLFVSKKNPHFRKSLSFATLIGDNLYKSGLVPTLHHAEKIKGENRKLLNRKLGIYAFDNLIVLKSAVMPAVLLECGIIVNRAEEKQVQTSRYKDILTDSIVSAIQSYVTEYR